MKAKTIAATVAAASVLAAGGIVASVSNVADNIVSWANGSPLEIESRIEVQTKTANDGEINFFVSPTDAPAAWTNTLNVFKIRRDWTRFYTEQSIADYNLGNRGNFGLFETSEVFTNGEWVSTAEGEYSFANGINVHAIGAFSHAEGCGVGWQIHKKTIKAENYDYETLLAKKVLGLGPKDGSDGEMIYFDKPVLAIGLGTHAEGLGTVASNSYSHAEGAFTLTAAQHAHSEGINTVASGEGAHSEGYGSTNRPVVAEGYCSHAEGGSTYAKGTISHAEGSNTKAFSIGSHAEGFHSVSTGNYSHAEGFYTIAEGVGSHSEGCYSIARGDNSHASGNRSESLKNYDFVWNGVPGAKRYSPDRDVVGTFNINPNGGLKGFYIGDQSLYDILNPATVEMVPVAAKSPKSPSSVRISTTPGSVTRIAGSGNLVIRPTNNISECKATLVVEGYSYIKLIGFRTKEDKINIEDEDPVAVFEIFKCGDKVFAIRQL